MSDPTSIIDAATIPLYQQGVWDQTKQMKPAMKLLEEKGKINGQDGGTQIEWNVLSGSYDQYFTGVDEDVSSKYNPYNLISRHVLNWGQISAFARWSRDELKRNRGSQALTDLQKLRIPEAFKAIFVNGSANAARGSDGCLMYNLLNRNSTSYAGTGLPIDGLPTIFKFDTGTSANLATVSSGATYAGQSIEENGLSGVDIQVDSKAWTPTGVNTDSTAFTDFATSTLDILDLAQTSVSFDAGDSMERPDCGIWAQNHFLVIKNAVTDKQTIFLNGQGADDKAYGVGGSIDMVYHNGLKHYWDVFMPSSTGYILNFDRIAMTYLNPVGHLSGDKAMGATGDAKGMCDWDVSYNAQRRGLLLDLQLDVQFQFSPKHQCKVADFS